MSTITELKSVLEATTDALTQNPEAGHHRVEARSDLVGTCTVSSPLGQHTITFDQAAPLGEDQGPTPGTALLAALGACQAQVYRIWSEKMGIAIDDLQVEVRGDLDVRRLFGTHDGVRAGFDGVEVHVRVSGPEPSDRYAELRRAVDAHCPMLDVVANPVPVRTAIHHV